MNDKRKARDIMTRTPQTVTPTEPVADAVDIMKAENCGVVPVVDPEDTGSLVGIITDRDVALRACCQGGHGPETPIVEVMSTDLAVVGPEDSVTHIREVMEGAGVRRVPVVEEGRLVGIISLKDLAEQVSSEAVGEMTDRILEQDPNN
jgi:CBS domain-containing protein